MEKVNIRSTRGQAKVVGTLLCIVGSLMFTFWKGGLLLKSFVEKPLVNIHGNSTSHSNTYYRDNWIKGSALILISYVAWSSWLILQVLITYIRLITCNTQVMFIFVISLA